MFLSRLPQLLLMNSCLLLQSLFQVSHLSFSLGSDQRKTEVILDFLADKRLQYLYLHCLSYLSSCCAAVVSRVSSSSVLRASSSSPKSLRCFSALERDCLSSSKSSCNSEICASFSLMSFWARFFCAASSSFLKVKKKKPQS